MGHGATSHCRKKAELVTQIGDLQQLHDGLEAFENNLNDARQECQFERIARYGEKNPGTTLN